MKIDVDTRRPLVRLALATGAVVAVVICVASCRDRSERPAPRNVVVLLADTLRADHLSLYGYRRPTSPRLDAVARARGVVFENVRAQAPCTFPSVNSLMTSRSPLRFVGEGQQNFAIPSELPTLATLLKGRGFSTAAVSASPIVRATPSAENPFGGFGAGFERFDESCSWLGADCVTNTAIAALDDLREPFLLYVHYLDPHDPYGDRGARPDQFAGEPPKGEGREFLRAGDPRPIAERIYEKGLDPGLRPGELDYLIARYDDEIHFWDLHVGRLLAELERRGSSERTAIAIVADHGESLLEHGHLMHCRSLYEPEIRVPMVYLVPGAGPSRISDAATNLDLLPTLMDIVGEPYGDLGLEGRSLRAQISGRRGRPEAGATLQRSWWGLERAVADGRFKLIAIAEPPPAAAPKRLVMFDLTREPLESVDVAREQSSELRRLRSELTEWMRREPTPGSAASGEIEEQLRALGYLQ